MNASVENYLRTMFSISEHEREISSVEISRLLTVTKPSVSAMMKRMEVLGLIRKKPYSKIEMTSLGKKEAKRIVRNRRIIEVFLSRKLNYTLKNMENEACKLEHAFSTRAINRMNRLLNKPKKCPHGKEIPR